MRGKSETKNVFHVIISNNFNEKESIKSTKSNQSSEGIMISHKWILDSISKGMLLNYKNYT